MQDREEKRRRKRDATDTSKENNTSTGSLLSRTKTVAPGAKAEQEGGLDDLISAIRTGKAFGGTDNTRRRDRSNQKAVPETKDKKPNAVPEKTEKVVVKPGRRMSKVTPPPSIPEPTVSPAPARGRRLSFLQNNSDKERVSVSNSIPADSPSSTTRGRRLSVSQNRGVNLTDLVEGLNPNSGGGERRSRRISATAKDRPDINMLNSSLKSSGLGELVIPSGTRKTSITESERPSNVSTGQPVRTRRLSVAEKERAILSESQKMGFKGLEED